MSAADSLLSPRDHVRLLSLVIPIYNEEQTIPLLRAAVTEFLDFLDYPAELVLVNDGSRDGSLLALHQWSQSDARVRVIAFARNFGHQAAATAGLDHAAGDAVVLIDADLQDPLDVIRAMLAKYLEGYDVVYGRRRSRAGETWFKKLTAWGFYRLLRKLGNIDLPPDTGDFRLISRRCLDALKALREQHRFLRGMCTWIGYPQTGVLYDRAPRAAGETKYPLRKMLRFALDAIFSFSAAPLRMSLYAGVFVAAIGLVYGAWGLIRYFLWQDNMPGWTSLIAMMALTNAAILISNGIMGEYLGRVFTQVKNRPLYVIAEQFGFPCASAVCEETVTSRDREGADMARLEHTAP